jgi:hypothetical protein
MLERAFTQDEKRKKTKNKRIISTNQEAALPGSLELVFGSITPIIARTNAATQLRAAMSKVLAIMLPLL